MNTTFFSQVLDDPLYIGNGEYVSVVTSGKVNIVGEARDISKDAAAKAGLLRVNTNTGESTFINFASKGEEGDRYRGAVIVDNKVYVMRTQANHIDSIVRLVCVDLADNSVEMIQEKAISVSGSVTPKTFCGHFNFGRPVVAGTSIVYPPLNSGIVIVYDTITRTFVSHDVPDDFSSIWVAFVPELNQAVFFPYGARTNKLLVLDLTANTHKFVEAPTENSFYCAFSHNGKAIGVPHIMGSKTQMYFWVYDGETVKSIEYHPSVGNVDGSNGFKYGSIDNDVFYTHTSSDRSHDLVKFDLKNNEITVVPSNLALGSKPITVNGNTYLFPSILNTRMMDAPQGVYKLVNGQIVKEFELPTNNITYGPINENEGNVLLVPYKFDLVDGKLSSQLTIVDLANSSAKTMDVMLELE
jgi:hypothetical protein